MSVHKFQTNINCKNCLRAVTPFLNGEARIKRWDVDLDDPGKILTIECENITITEIVTLLSKAGYTAEPLE
jgi:copper chaperone CopZ